MTSSTTIGLSGQFNRLPGIAYRCLITPEWPMLSMSPGCEAVTGWPPEAFISGEVNYADLIEPEHRGRVWSAVQEALDEGKPFRIQYTIVDRFGQRRRIWEQGHGVPDDSGRMRELEGLICDITPDEEGSADLARSRHFIERVVTTMPGHVTIYDLKSAELLYSNGPQRSGLRAAQPVGPWRTTTHFLDRLHPEDKEPARRWLSDWADVSDGQVVEWRYRVLGDDDRWSWRWLRATPFERDTAGAVRQVLCVSVDTTEREEAVRALADSEQRHRTVLEGASDGMFICDEHLHFVQVNAAGQELLNMDSEALLATDLFALVHPDEPALLPPKALVARGSRLIERRLQRSDGAWVSVEMHSRVLPNGYYLAIVRDLSARKDAENERLDLVRSVMEAQRLESLGLLSGGIAHDFNNLLATILGSAEMLLHEWPTDTPGRTRLERIALASRRASELTRQLLDYVGEPSLAVQDVHLDSLVREMPLLLEASIGSNVGLSYDIASKLPVVQGDRSQLQQVAMNLVVNASEAIGSERGTVYLRLRRTHVDAAAILNDEALGDLMPGLYVLLEVEDDGCGIAADRLERIFEPFVSSKATGRGLGLAAVRGIVTGHQGAMQLVSEVNKGTCVRVWLPAQARQRQRYHSGVWDTGWKGVGHVLIVDDEANVRDVLGELVEALGFGVHDAASGQTALDFLDSEAEKIAVVLLDVTMPGMDGAETWRRIASRLPELPVVLMSGMAAPELGEVPEGAAQPGFLMKPFSLDKLRKALQDATGQR
ncbi:MAG: PAS domain-containing protein [Myxococcales bacterium]|nr:PAS domain-containing protein [Myxococcales bacterium]